MRLSDRSSGVLGSRGQRAVAVVAAGALAAGTLALASPVEATAIRQAGQATATGTPYCFTTLNNPADPAFTELLGINKAGVIAGYAGAGTKSHPSQGHLLNPPYGQTDYVRQNFPGSAQTQVTGINNAGDTAGFWVGSDGTSRGFVRWHGVFTSYADPRAPKGAVNQLLGLNDAGLAVGFYYDARGHAHAYELNRATGQFTAITIPGAVSATAAGINNAGDIVGYFSTKSGATSGFLRTPAGRLVTFSFPGGRYTQALGINFRDQIVGSYLSSTKATRGFVLSNPLGSDGEWQSIDDPSGTSTVVNGIDWNGDLVGYYTDGKGRTSGFLAVPNVRTVRHLTLTPMPVSSVSFGRRRGDLTATVTGHGFTPGSAHTAALESKSGTVLTVFSTLTASSVGQVSATLSSSFTRQIPAGARFGILNGLISGSRIAQVPIAVTAELSGPADGQWFRLASLVISTAGTDYGTPQGQATIVYDPSAHTLSVTVQARGLTPGLHAAHVHSGSCLSQGPVVYMIPDFRASTAGQVSQTSVVTKVNTPIPPAGWYLNLHLGNSNNILTSSGQPTIYFRPLLCASIQG
jgi:hypothetical protein